MSLFSKKHPKRISIEQVRTDLYKLAAERKTSASAIVRDLGHRFDTWRGLSNQRLIYPKKGKLSLFIDLLNLLYYEQD